MNSNRMFGLVVGIVLLLAPTGTFGQISTTPTMDTGVLRTALNPNGLTITSLLIRNGLEGQFGTYTHFSTPPVTIRDGLVMSSGSVLAIGPLAEVHDPAYDPSSPPAAVNSQMNPEIDGGTPEFNAFGAHSNNVENFQASFDVAAIEVHFTLAEDSQVKFDFLFGSVEFPFWTSAYTDAFIVFLDGSTPNDQIAFDRNGHPVQVGSSFAGLTVTDDANTAFAAPHGLIHHLTTTTQRLDAGPHTLIFEVGDVNDHVLDSTVFLSNLRTGSGTPGTDPSDDCRADYDSSGVVNVQDIFQFLADWFDGEHDADFDGNGVLGVPDIFGFLAAWFVGCP